MAYGEIYVEVDASVVNGGIMPMGIISGNPEPVAGQESFGVWLRWQYEDTTGEGGFTNSGWYWEDKNNALRDSFATEEEFKAMLVQDTPKDLDQYLGNWGGDRKSEFFNVNQNSLAANNCFTFYGS